MLLSFGHHVVAVGVVNDGVDVVESFLRENEVAGDLRRMWQILLKLGRGFPGVRVI